MSTPKTRPHPHSRTPCCDPLSTLLGGTLVKIRKLLCGQNWLNNFGNLLAPPPIILRYRVFYFKIKRFPWGENIFLELKMRKKVRATTFWRIATGTSEIRWCFFGDFSSFVLVSVILEWSDPDFHMVLMRSPNVFGIFIVHFSSTSRRYFPK